MGAMEKKRSRRWVWITLLLVLLGGVPAGCLAWGAYSFSEAGRPQPVECAKALAFAHGALPAGARDAHCTAMHWQDTYVEAEFRMERAAVAGWLAETYPSAVAEPPPSAGTDGGTEYHVSFPPAAGKAYEVGVAVRDEGGGTALVRVTAYDS